MSQSSKIGEFEIQIDEKPNGVVIRVNDEKRCVLRICNIPNYLVFAKDGTQFPTIDITYPQEKKK